MSTGIQMTPSPGALATGRQARAGWRKAVSQTINGWGLVTAEQHRIALIKGDDLVFFAPAGVDFDNPAPISESDKSQALAAAVNWARSHAGPLN